MCLKLSTNQASEISGIDHMLEIRHKCNVFLVSANPERGRNICGMQPSFV